MSYEGRVKIVESMGWKQQSRLLDAWVSPRVALTDEPVFQDGGLDASGRWYISDLPDPFHNIVHDYELLLWVRETEKPKHSAEWCDFWMDLNHAASYQIGDYARAWLKALEKREARYETR